MDLCGTLRRYPTAPTEKPFGDCAFIVVGGDPGMSTLLQLATISPMIGTLQEKITTFITQDQNRYAGYTKRNARIMEETEAAFMITVLPYLPDI
jgi:hypothetical protein